MTKHWLRGILLGVSLALFLAGGVAMAQTLSLTADKECVECWPGPYTEPPADEYFVYLTVDGWIPSETLCYNMYHNGESIYSGPYCGAAPPVEQPYTIPWFLVACGMPDRRMVVSGFGPEVQLDGVEDFYGEWKTVFWQPGTDNLDSAIWRFADVCEAEFVPEPGTMVLLGSGLAGLAGYATLRLRSRRALH